MSPIRWNDNLSDPHLTIAKSTSRRIAILAGPGTGKTSLGLLRRIMRLLQDDKVSPEKILFLTFSRTAANDFREKLDQLGVERGTDIEALTLHSFCLRVLKDERVFQITGRNANRILMSYEENVMLQDLPSSFGTLKQKEKMLEKFASGWAEDIDQYPGDPTNEEEKKFQELLLEWLKQHQAVLMGEVVPLAYRYLVSNPTSEFFQKYTHIIVDEYQDLNKVEQALIELMVGEGKENALCIAGDDDQSIYRFRFANPDGIREFFEKAEEKVKISICGRCPLPVLNIANKIKDFLPKSTKGPLICRDEKIPGSVTVVQWNDSEEEISGIAAAIKQEIEVNQREPGDFLVLVQSKPIGVGIRNAIKELGVECQSYFQEDPINNIEAKRAFTILELLVNSSDLVALRYWLGHGDSSAKRDQYAQFRAIMEKENISLTALLERLSINPNSTPGFKSFVDKYKELQKILTNLENKSLEEVIDFVFPDSVTELADLRRTAQLARQGANDTSSLLDSMTRMITQPDIPENPDFVRVMSLHKSKGLTSKVVIIAALVEGLIPRQTAQSDKEEMDESRRLFYVAVTRAQEGLILSSFASTPASRAFRMQIKLGRYLKQLDGIKYFNTITSRFVQEIASVTPKAVTGVDWLRTRTFNN